MLLSFEGVIVYDAIISSGPQSITLPNSLPSGNYTLYSMDPYDMNKVIQETVAIPNCIAASPSVTPTPTISTSPASGSVSVTPTPTITVTPSITVTPTKTPTPSPVFTTVVNITKYPQIQSGGTIEVWNTYNVKILTKNTSDLSIGSNSFSITPYAGPYTIYLQSIYKIDSTTAYTAISSNTGEYQTSVYGFMSVNGYGRLSSGISTIGITLGEPT
jgi:hypothetical protein